MIYLRIAVFQKRGRKSTNTCPPNHFVSPAGHRSAAWPAGGAYDRGVDVISGSASGAGPGPVVDPIAAGVRTPAVYLVRHGETAWSRTGQHTSRTDVSLTAFGEQQARRAGAVLARLRATDLPPALVLTSPRERAFRTAVLAGLAVDETTEALAEWDYGEYEGRTTPEIREEVPGWTVWSHPVPGGETADAVSARAAGVLARVRAALPGGDVVLVGHGHFSRVLVAGWLGLPAAQGVHFGLDPAGITVLGDERGDPQVRRSNVPPWGDT
jgi:probable phosphoglycerate mutase